MNNKALFLKDSSAYNMYHFMIYMLSHLSNMTGSYDTLYIGWGPETTHYFTHNHNFAFEALRLIFPSINIIRTLNTAVHLDCDHVIVTDDARFSTEIRRKYRYLRGLFFPHISNHLVKPYSKRIYISRGDAHYRYITNEKEVMEALTKIGFHCLSLKGMSFIDQISLFYHADTILSIHGAALTNLIFCKPDTRVIEFATPYMRENSQHFKDISETFNLNYQVYDGNISEVRIKNQNNMEIFNDNNITINDIDQLVASLV